MYLHTSFVFPLDALTWTSIALLSSLYDWFLRKHAQWGPHSISPSCLFFALLFFWTTSNFRGHFRVLGGYRSSPSTLPAFDPSVQRCSCVFSSPYRPSCGLWFRVCVRPTPGIMQKKKVFWMSNRSCDGNVLVLAKQPLSLVLSLSLIRYHVIHTRRRNTPRAVGIAIKVVPEVGYNVVTHWRWALSTRIVILKE